MDKDIIKDVNEEFPEVDFPEMGKITPEQKEYTPEEQKSIDIYNRYTAGNTYASITKSTGINKNAIKGEAKKGADILGIEFKERESAKGRPAPAKASMKVPGGNTATVQNIMSKANWKNAVLGLHGTVALFTQTPEFKITEAEAGELGECLYDAFKDTPIEILDKYGKYIGLIGAVLAIEVPCIQRGIKAINKKKVAPKVQPRAEESAPKENSPLSGGDFVPEGKPQQ